MLCERCRCAPGVLMIEAVEPVNCCCRSLLSLCSRCLSHAMGAGATNDPYPLPSLENVVIIPTAAE